MKLPHWIVVALAVIGAVLPIVVKEVPAQYSGAAMSVLAIFAALKVQALRQSS